MKKLLAVLVVISILFCSGCMSADPVKNDLNKYVNTDMSNVNANYKKIIDEADRWSSFTEYTQYQKSINEKLLPAVDDAISNLELVNPETEDVKNLKQQLSNSLIAYKKQLEDTLQALNDADYNEFASTTAKVNVALAQIGDYNKSLNDLAKAKKVKVPEEIKTSDIK